MLNLGFLLAIGSLTVALACENGNHLPDGRKCPSTGLHVRNLQISAIINKHLKSFLNDHDWDVNIGY